MWSSDVYYTRNSPEVRIRFFANGEELTEHQLTAQDRYRAHCSVTCDITVLFGHRLVAKCAANLNASIPSGFVEMIATELGLWVLQHH